MKYRNLGRSGLKVSELSFGSWVTFNKQVDLNLAEKLAAKVLALPHHQNLSKEHILYACKKINSFYN